MVFTSSQSSGNLKMIDNRSWMLASSIVVLGCILPSLMGLCMSSCLMYRTIVRDLFHLTIDIFIY